MYNKFSNIKKAGTILIVLIIVIFLIANIRIRSVSEYRKQAGNNLTVLENMQSTEETSQSDRNTSGHDASVSEKKTQESSVAEESETYSDTNELTDIDNEDRDSGNTGNIIKDYGTAGDDNLGDKENATGKQDAETSQTEAVKPSGQVITCTIEIRCDNATARKDSIANPGIRNAIPDDGTILEVTTYTAAEGFTVYDVLAAVTAMHNPVIPIVANSDKSYVSSINNLSEKNVGPQSGWTYRVDGKLYMIAANNYTVKDGDVIKWIYVCQMGDM